MMLSALFGGVACGAVPEDRGPRLFTFGVFGDGPYYPTEMGRYREVLRQVEDRDAAFLLHVGDMLWYPCTEEAYRSRRASLDALPLPVIYTPGDNEWTDCHEPRPGGYEPLDRLRLLRRVFFDTPARSLGGMPLALESQGSDSAFAEFVENVRWVRDSVVFATLHVVGSTNATDPFPGRTSAHDREAERRLAAAVAWTRSAFREAHALGARAVVLVIHADPDFPLEFPADSVFDPLKHVWAVESERFGRPVLLVHGDSHEQIVDRPLVHPATGDRVPNFTRLQTFGSPDIGWIEVIVDPTDPAMFRFVPRLMSAWRVF